MNTQGRAQRAMARVGAIVILLSGVITVQTAVLPVADTWTDRSGHAVRLVTAAPGVLLEVLEWAGPGRPVVLLAGAGHSAHVFDEFAPALARDHRVVAITRRGYGGSSRPAHGYDDATLANDVLTVLDALTLASPVVVGHSMAGGEMTTLARTHPRRIGGLVYLEALADPRRPPSDDAEFARLHAALPAALKAFPSEPEPRSRSIDAYRAWQRRTQGVAFPEADLRNVFDVTTAGVLARYRTSGDVHRAIGEGQVARDYAGIGVPALSIEDPPRPGAQRAHEYQPCDDAERRALDAMASLLARHADLAFASLVRHVPDARRVLLPGAGHYPFLTAPDETLRHVRKFLQRLPIEATRR